MLKQISLVAILIFTVGCAARVGPVEWAVGDAHVKTCPKTAAPDCENDLAGGHLSAVFGQLWDSTIGAAARVFGAAAQPTVIVAPPPAK